MSKLIPPPGNIKEFNQAWRNWENEVYKKLKELSQRRGCLVTRNTNQSIPNSTYTFIIFDTANATEVYDTDGIHDLVTNPTRLTVPAGVSKVKVSGTMNFAANATGIRQVELYKNNATFPGAMLIRSISNTSFFNTIMQVSSPVIEVVPGNYFELRVWQNSGGALNYTGSTVSWFSMEIIE